MKAILVVLCFMILLFGAVKGQTINDNMVNRPSFSNNPVWGNPNQLTPRTPQPPPPVYRPQGSYDPFNPKAQQPVLQPQNASQIAKTLYPELNGQQPPTQEQIRQSFIELTRPKGVEYEKRANTYLQGIYQEFKQGGAVLCYKKPMPIQKEAYLKARKNITDMLEGKTSASLKRAVFEVENAFYSQRLSWNEYDSLIQQGVRIVKSLIQDTKHPKTPYSALLQYWKDTTIDPLTKRKHFPISYDFVDYLGQKSYAQMFVFKLLKSNKGQCHSLPLLYKIIADELGIKSHIAFAPMHSYIQHPDGKGNLIHLELTNTAYVNVSTYFQTGYIKQNAVKSGVFLTPLDDAQTLVYCLTDLANQYALINPIDPDNFVLETAHYALSKFPNFFSARILMANVHTYRFNYEMKRAGSPSIEIVKTNPYYTRLYNNMMQSYNDLDALGYEIIPKEIYDQWLHSLA